MQKPQFILDDWSNSSDFDGLILLLPAGFVRGSAWTRNGGRNVSIWDGWWRSISFSVIVPYPSPMGGTTFMACPILKKLWILK